MTSKYMSFSPQLVNERNNALNNCPTKSGRSQIYRTYYLKMKAAYEKHEEEQDEAEEEYDEDDEDDEEEDDEDYEPSEDEEYEEEYEEDEEEPEDEEPENEVIDENATEYCCCDRQAYEVDDYEVDENEVEADGAESDEEDENEFGCPGCNYEWRDGYKNGWKDAMKYIASKTHKEVPDTPACSYCDIVCKTRKCGGKCGGVARYCSFECQKQDWAFGHKNTCGK